MGERLDHLFPRFHVRPPVGYVNDPNGPIVIDGVVHLYCQQRESVDAADPVRWGHVTSRDLVRWQEHPAALVPHPGLGDADGCWSGNTLLDQDGLVRAFYSGRVEGEPLQRTLGAMSHDGGHSFGAPREVVAAPDGADGVRELRDPFVWREANRWLMVLGAGTFDDTAVVRAYASDDLDDWVYLGPLASLPRSRTPVGDSGAMWECPQLVTLGEQRIVVVSACAPDTGLLRVLSFPAPDPDDRPALDPDRVRLVDHGPDFYAASVMQSGLPSPVLWGWATEARDAQWCEVDGWSGMLTLPRSLSLRPDGSLGCAPPDELIGLRVPGSEAEVTGQLAGVGAQLEFELSIDAAGAGTGTLRLGFGPDEWLDVVVDADAGVVSVDRDHASADPRAEGGVVTVPVGGREGLRTGLGGLRGFVDGSVLELFLPSGEVVTVRFYPTTPPPWRLELRSTGWLRARAWELIGGTG